MGGGGGASAVTFATLDPGRTGSGIVLSNGNRRATHDGTTGDFMSKSTSSKTTGKFYFEMSIPVETVGAFPSFGIAGDTAILTTWVGGNGVAAQSSYGYYGFNGQSYHNTSGIAFGAAYGMSEIIGCAVDLGASKIWWSRNNIWQAGGDPAAGTGSQYTLTAAIAYRAAVGVYAANEQVQVNLAAGNLVYSAPSGFTAGWTA